MIIKVVVTADHIAHGEPINCEACPIALAATEALARSEEFRSKSFSIDAYPDNGIISIWEKGYIATQYEGGWPEPVAVFINNFDSSRHRYLARPLNFDWEIEET